MKAQDEYFLKRVKLFYDNRLKNSWMGLCNFSKKGWQTWLNLCLKRTMYQRKVDVDMLNAVKSVLADVSSVSPSSEQRDLCLAYEHHYHMPFFFVAWLLKKRRRYITPKSFAKRILTDTGLTRAVKERPLGCSNHAQQLMRNSGGSLDNQTWHTNHWLQQKLPKFGFRTHTTALWPMK